MRKLQDLLPDLDKQTNTADMLDMAVEYIKDQSKSRHSRILKLSAGVQVNRNITQLLLPELCFVQIAKASWESLNQQFMNSLKKC
ncbi:hypothetical protein SLA2020_433780 [Shorea laevis]